MKTRDSFLLKIYEQIMSNPSLRRKSGEEQSQYFQFKNKYLTVVNVMYKITQVPRN